MNESFTVLSAVSRLRALPPDQQCSIFFNFSITPGAQVVSSSLWTYVYMQLSYLRTFRGALYFYTVCGRIYECLIENLPTSHKHSFWEKRRFLKQCMLQRKIIHIFTGVHLHIYWLQGRVQVPLFHYCSSNGIHIICNC